MTTSLVWRSIARRGSADRLASRPLRFVPLLLSILLLPVTSCTHAPVPRIAGAPAAPPSPSEPWRVPRGVVPPERPAPETFADLPPDVAPRREALALVDIVDIALRNNPQTQLSWAQARAGAATYGAASAAFVPTVDASVNAAYSQTTVGQTLGGVGTRRSVTPAVNLSYLLLDFGGRRGSVNAARAAAVALDLTHNATLQNVALQAEAAYFDFQARRALLGAARITVAEADTNLNSARNRNRAGVATIADVLQAETQLAQAQLALETAEGDVEVSRGLLAVAMGLRANARYDLAPVNDSIAVVPAAGSVDSLIDQALVDRPDLAAARMQIEQSRAEVDVARSALYPSITLGSTATHPYSSQPNASGTTLGVTVGVSIPIFNLARPYNVMAARAQLDVASARASLLRTDVAQQVYTSYYLLRTATQRSRTADALLSSATRSEDAARARYRAGVGTIVDLITAQAALANARAQQAQSRWVWATALAQLSHDVGTLGPRGATVVPLAPDSSGVRR